MSNAYAYGLGFGMAFDASAKPPFNDWMRDVDKAAYAIAGVSIHDLPDCPFRDWYDAGVNARSAASRCLKSAKE